MHVVVTGSHGLIGSALVPALEAAGHSVKRLRRPDDWDAESGRVEPAALHGAGAVVHLAGEGVAARRWSDEQKRRIRDSRVKGTTALATAVAALDEKPRVFVSGSAIGWYGDRGDEVLTEESDPGTGFLAEVCRDWEAATKPAEGAGVRVVHLRSGIVLSGKGGALGRQLPLFRLGLGGRLGRGRQWVSWIALDDEVGAILHALTNESVQGPVNLTAPAPATNAEFTKALARAVRRPAVLPVPRSGLTVVLGRELARELLGSQRALPTRLEATGYQFSYPDIDTALVHVLGR